MLVASTGWWFGSIIFFIIWVAIAFWPARVAGRKGHSFFGYFLFSLVFFPAALIVPTWSVIEGCPRRPNDPDQVRGRRPVRLTWCFGESTEAPRCFAFV